MSPVQGKPSTHQPFATSETNLPTTQQHSTLAKIITRLWANRPLVVMVRLTLDAALIVCAFLLAYYMRYSLRFGVDLTEQYYLALTVYVPSIFIYSLIFVATLQLRGFYTRKRQANLLDEIGIIINSALITVAVELAAIFISRIHEFSRLMFVFVVVLSVTFLIIERCIVRSVRRSLWLRGIGVRNVLVIGATDVGSRLMQSLVENPNLGYRLFGYIDDEIRFSEWILPARYRNGEDVPYLGSLERLEGLIATNRIEEVMLALPSNRYDTTNDIIARCRENNVSYKMVPDLFELRLDSFSLLEIKGVPLIGLKNNNLRGWNYILKRIIDIILSGGALLLLSPIILLIALAIKLDSPGSIIYRQTRIGKNGKLFTFYKFRSMRTDADQKYFELLPLNETGGATFKLKNDPRRTRVGKFIRRTSLDEIPQFVNILLGQMSFVGPRPTIDREISQYQAWHRRRLEVTPGLTGLWQVSGRSKIPFEDMVKLDIYYAENWSLWLDIKILLRTIPAVIRGDGAY